MTNIILLLVLMCVINLWTLLYTRNVNDSSLSREPFLGSRVKSYYKFPKYEFLGNLIKPFMGDGSQSSNNLNIPQPFKIGLAEQSISQINNYVDANIIFFTLLIDYKKHYNKLFKNAKHKYIYSLLCVDDFANKALMYSMFTNNVNRQSVIKFLPVTFVIDDSVSFNKLLDTFDENKVYILKKNVQRQKGCTLTNNKEYISLARKNNYVVCQELLQNPYTIKGLKINLRQYLLVIVDDKQCKFLLFNNGFLYYTPKKFIANSLDKNRHITTGYIDRRVYEENPMTVKELYTYLGEHDANILKANIKELFRCVADVYTKHILSHDINQHTNFMIFGCDVAVASDLSCKIMEINKGPDLSYKDNRDGAVKHTLAMNTLHEVGIINKPHKNFIHL